MDLIGCIKSGVVGRGRWGAGVGVGGLMCGVK